MYFDNHFWRSLLVQASLVELALAHAVVTVGVFAEQRSGLCGNEQRNLETSHEHMARATYNKSITQLAKLSVSANDNTEVILLACILYICVEFLRGNEEEAVRHFNGGMAIIANLIAGKDGSSAADRTIDGIRSTGILTFFNRLEMLAALFDNDSSWPYAVTLQESIPSEFHSISTARDSLVHLMNLSLRFIRSVGLAKYDLSFANTYHAAFDEQRILLRHLQLWRSRFSAYQARHASGLSSTDFYACNVLEIQRLVADIWVKTTMTPLECAHDEHMPALEAIITLAEQLSTMVDGTKSQRERARYNNTFLLDTEIVGPLHWVSIKCRDPTLRRRAINVLRGTDRREGKWDSRMSVAVAERVMAIEEEELLHGDLPSEEARVHIVSIKSDAGLGPSKHALTFFTKPDGVYGDWKVWQEVVQSTR
ncbi:hypothetical protein CB0940_02251 [Cercospora beticola]|uniref:C6 zinc finger domain protein n=1 Tax=Cercospora beticola TaxID=122368 RepID=A0A2G5IA02_CERBT|nr:hypothetical protein CB0940_02251 [Cercospora beticola]PIB01611.1 hypothetical protein CB0940_02251 [Cercospora beticola]WPA97586.1 hypothetical protein RHO25_002196 [Cercospora beticola]